MNAEGRRLALAILLSLLIHALLLSLTFGGEGLGLPGFSWPWQERRIEAPDLRVVLVPAPGMVAEPAGASVRQPLPLTSIGQTVADEPAPTLTVWPAAIPEQTEEAIAPEAEATARTRPEPGVASGALVAAAPMRTEGLTDRAPAPMPAPDVIAIERADDATWVVPAVPPAPTPVIAAAPGASGPDTLRPAPREAGDPAQEPIDVEARQRAVALVELERSEREAQRQAARQEAARREAERVEAARLEAARLEAERLEAAGLAAARKEAERQEAARRDTERIEAARLEAAKKAAAQQEAARLEAARQEATRRETERIEAARLEAARLEAARLEAARLAAARLEAARQEADRRDAERIETARLEAERLEAARQAAARLEAARAEAEERREAVRRAMGRQLDEEAARREAASKAAGPPSRLAPSSSSARRGRLFGRTDSNAELVLYAEAWARKIQLNMTFDIVREAVKRPHADPLVTVAIRSDGSVESVTFVISSGVADIDEAIRRVVESLLPYQAFPPALARDYDVIEIRRTWHFDMAIRLY